MLTDTKLRSSIDSIWNKLWSGGLSNPLDAIEQLSYLIFLKRLDDEENRREKQAQRTRKPFEPRVPAEMRWSHWTHLKAEDALAHLKTQVFPWLKTLGQPLDTSDTSDTPDTKDTHPKPPKPQPAPSMAAPETDNSFTRYMKEAEFKLNKAGLLIEVCAQIDQMQISTQNQDVQGDLYEYMLSKLDQAGRNGQFRTPRHIIRMMVQMLDPKKNERIGDLAAGTCGFLVNAYQHILEHNTSANILTRDADGQAHNLIGDKLSNDERDFLQSKAFRGYDSDSGMVMLRIGSMNLMLHGIAQPSFYWTDTLSKAYAEARDYDVILMNPPFKGAVDKDDVSPTLPSDTTKSELLFVHLILRVLDNGGRCAVIVPDGVLFGSSKAHVNLRKRLIEENRLDGVISMPSGVFKPYAGVSTAILLFTKGAKTDKIWFYDMSADGFSLDDKRDPRPTENDIPDVLLCWKNRKTARFQQERSTLLNSLRERVQPLKAQRLTLHAEINRLQFETTIAPPLATGAEPSAGEQALAAAKAKLAGLEAQIAPLHDQIGQLAQQFWVDQAQVAANKYDLSASRYRQADQDDEYYETPQVTLQRLLTLERVIGDEVRGLETIAGSAL